MLHSSVLNFNFGLSRGLKNSPPDCFFAACVPPSCSSPTSKQNSPSPKNKSVTQRSGHGFERRKTFAVEMNALARASDIQRSFLSGASGDTELFEKASNINGFQGGRVANNLYISLFSGDCFSDSRPFSIPQFKCRDLGGKSAFSFAVACVLNMTWVFSLRQSCHAGGIGLLYEPRLSHSLRRRVGT